MRTRQEIAAECERQYAKLQKNTEREAKARAEQEARETFRRRYACAKCRWHDGGYISSHCTNPLVKADKHWRDEVGTVDQYLHYAPAAEEIKPKYGYSDFASLCGIERALWHAKLTRWQRLLAFLGLIDPDVAGERRWDDEEAPEAPAPAKEDAYALNEPQNAFYEAQAQSALTGYDAQRHAAYLQNATASGMTAGAQYSVGTVNIGGLLYYYLK